MLIKDTKYNFSDSLYKETESYLAETMHSNLILRSWTKGEDLPFYLRSAYEFKKGVFLGKDVLCLFAKETLTPQKIEKHLNTLASYWNERIVVVFDALPNYVRRRLMERGISFVVPKVQLYLPEFGLDYRSRVKRPTEKRKWLRPSAQMLLLYLIMHPDETTHTASTLASLFDQSVMTICRAIAELKTHEFIETIKEGRNQQVRLCKEPKQTWDSAQKVLRNPIKRRLTIEGYVFLQKDSLIAGASALSQSTMLDEPRERIYAMSTKVLRKWLSDNDTIIENHSLVKPGGEIWILEEWSYDPRPLSKGREVDSLSLYLSLKDDADERVQKSLELLLGDFGSGGNRSIS